MPAEDQNNNDDQRTAMNSADRVEDETKKRHMVRLRGEPAEAETFKNALKTFGFHRKSEEAGKTKVREKRSMICAKNKN